MSKATDLSETWLVDSAITALMALSPPVPDIPNFSSNFTVLPGDILIRSRSLVAIDTPCSCEFIAGFQHLQFFRRRFCHIDRNRAISRGLHGAFTRKTSPEFFDTPAPQTDCWGTLRSFGALPCSVAPSKGIHRKAPPECAPEGSDRYPR
jgi:hypothetical protein